MIEDIQKVDAPEFLLTRIQQRIREIEQNKFPIQLVWTFAFSFCILVFVNALMLERKFETNNSKVNLAEKFHLQPTNSFYNE